MNDGTRDYVRELAIGAGALMRCPRCGEPHIGTDDNALIEGCISAVEASREEGDLRLMGMADVGAFVRAIVSESDTGCPLETMRGH